MDDTLVADYMVEKLGIDKSKIPDLCNLLYKNYGTTMAGLRVRFWLIVLFIAGITCRHWQLRFMGFSCAGNWLRLWLWWIPQVRKLVSLGFFLSPFIFPVCLLWYWSRRIVIFLYAGVHSSKSDWPFTFLCYSFVHGRLPYENLKPDPVLRKRLLSLPYRKVVSY